MCGHTNNAASCEDGDACTVGDVCADGICGPGAARDCDDANPCTDDDCAPTSGCTNDRNSLCAPGCGDLVVGAGETCDPPNLAIDPVTGLTTCRLTCTSCGDGNPDAGETCDDGNTVTGCRTDKPQKPNDACNNNCTQPICKDPARITLGPVSGELLFHARLTGTEGRVLDVAGQSFTVRLVAGPDEAYSLTLPARSLAERANETFYYKNRSALLRGTGAAAVKIKRFRDHYRVYFRGTGSLGKAAASMTTLVEVGGETWNMEGHWVRTSKGWKLKERTLEP